MHFEILVNIVRQMTEMVELTRTKVSHTRKEIVVIFDG